MVVDLQKETLDELERLEASLMERLTEVRGEVMRRARGCKQSDAIDWSSKTPLQRRVGQIPNKAIWMIAVAIVIVLQLLSRQEWSPAVDGAKSATQRAIDDVKTKRTEHVE